MPDLPESGVQLVAKDAEKFRRDMDQAKGKVREMGSDSKKAATDLNTLSTSASKTGSVFQQLARGDISGAFLSLLNVLGPVGIAIGAVASSALVLFNQLNKQTEAIRQQVNAVDDLADRYGLTMQKANELNNISQIFGLNVASLALAFRTMARNGLEPSIQGLIGVKKELDGIDDPTQRLNRAFQVLGRGAVQFADLLATPTEQLERWVQNANDLAVITGRMTDQQDEFNRTVGLSKVAIQAANTQIQYQILLEKQSVSAMLQDFNARQALREAILAMGGELSSTLPTMEELIRQFALLSEAQRVGATDVEAYSRGILSWEDRMRAAQRATMEATGATGDFSEEAEAAASEVNNIQVESIWDKVFPDPATLAGKIADQIAFIQAGGPQLVAALEEVQTMLANKVLTPEEALPMLDDIQEAALAIPVAAGDTNIWDAARTNADDFGGSIYDAKKDIEAASKIIAGIPRSITIRILMIRSENLPGGFQHGGSFIVGGRPGPDANLVAFRATRGERVDITPASSVTENRVSNAKTVVFSPTVTTDIDGMALLDQMRQEVQRQ